MRLDAMCCEVSLSHWIEPGRLTAALRYRRLRGRKGRKAAPAPLQGRAGPAELCRWLLLHFASSFLLVPVGFEAPVTFYLPLQQLCLFGSDRGGCGVSHTNDLSNAGIAQVNKWLGRSYRNVIKMHLFEWDLGLCKEAQNSPWAVLYNRVVAGWNKSP